MGKNEAGLFTQQRTTLVLVTPHKAEVGSLVLIKDMSAYVKYRTENNAVQMV